MPGVSGNRAGKVLEDAVAGLVSDANYRFVDDSELFFALIEMEQPMYARQCEVGRNIYGKPWKADLILYHPRKWPNCLIISCKWQARSGSTDEKYPFEVLTLNQVGYDAIIVLDGGGYSKPSEQWLRNQAGKNVLKHVFQLGEFQRFVSRGRI